MPAEQTNAPQASDSPAVWLPVVVVAARLGLSERTVQRRARRGELEAREVSDEQGKRLLIRLDLPTPVHAQSGEAADILARPADKLPSGADTSLTAHLIEENRFLRATVEQHQRSEAELRAALREALKAQPKQLSQGTNESARNAPQRAQTGDAGRNSQQPSGRAGIEAHGLSYGDIADMIEQELNR